MKKLNKKGFTLVELLAVIVVLALLMVVAASSIGSALDNSKKSALKTQAQKVLTTAAQDAISAQLLDGTTTYISPVESGKLIEQGDYAYYIEASVSGGVATVTKYCVLYMPKSTTESSITTYTGDLSLGKGSANLTTFDDLPAPVKTGTNSCKVKVTASGSTYTYAIEEA